MPILLSVWPYESEMLVDDPSPHMSPSNNGWQQLWPGLQPADIIMTCRDYLLMAANRAVPPMRVRAAPSDLVQEAIIDAVKDFDTFKGTSERELLAWLNKILANRIVNEIRRDRREKNDIRREISFDDEVHEIEHSLSGSDGTPSAFVIAQEERLSLFSAIESLDEMDQKVIRLKNWERLTFEAIGQQLGLTESGARKRWGRAIKQLRRHLKG